MGLILVQISIFVGMVTPYKKWRSIYFQPYLIPQMGQLYSADVIGHIQSFRSHITLTLRTPVLFIFRWVAAIGHGMKYHLSSLDKCSRGRSRRPQSFYLSKQENKEQVPEDYLLWALC